MLPNKTTDTYPRRLTEIEKKYLRKILPIDRIGYKYYNEKLDELFIIGKGRFQKDDYVLGSQNDKPDFTTPASPMFAAGKIITSSHKVEISIHEEFEDKIEFDFAVTGDGEFNESIQDYWTYSEWLPGLKSPPDKSDIREVHLEKNNIVIAIAAYSKRVWVYEFETGINHLIPVTNFYNEIMRVKNERNPKIALEVKRLFTHLNELTDQEIIQGFLSYNRYLNKIKIDYSLFLSKDKSEKKSFLNIFGGKKIDG